MPNAPLHPALVAGNTALVTGAASGIGLAAAHRLASLGLRVALVDRDESRLKDAAAQIGENTLALPADVGDPAAIERVANTVEQRLGPVSVLLNNAGVGGGGDVLAPLESWQRVLDVNLLGVLHGVQRFAPPMIASDRPGLIVNTGSKQGITQPPGDTAYNVSKSAVKALTEGLAHTLREKTGTRVTAHLLIPGFTFTGMTARGRTELPPGAWTPEQVVERMLSGIARNEFYLLCQDGETTREQDERRILWHTGDLIESRPALSRWHPDFKDAFARFVAGERD